MFEPIRGGTRGGQAEFKWSDVSQDKDRENYLGHSINAPTGRWQKSKDIHWYQREVAEDEEARLEEIRLVKEQEAEALAAMLGFASGKPGAASATAGPASGANAVAVPPKAGGELDPEKEERRKRKAERKEEKRAKKEAKREAKGRGRGGRGDSEERERRHGRSRSRSPRRRDERDKGGERSLPSHRKRVDDYDAEARERERERDRRRWETNARRDQPSGARRGRD